MTEQSKNQSKEKQQNQNYQYYCDYDRLVNHQLILIPEADIKSGKAVVIRRSMPLNSDQEFVSSIVLCAKCLKQQKEAIKKQAKAKKQADDPAKLKVYQKVLWNNFLMEVEQSLYLERIVNDTNQIKQTVDAASDNNSEQKQDKLALLKTVTTDLNTEAEAGNMKQLLSNRKLENQISIGLLGKKYNSVLVTGVKGSGKTAIINAFARDTAFKMISDNSYVNWNKMHILYLRPDTFTLMTKKYGGVNGTFYELNAELGYLKQITGIQPVLYLNQFETLIKLYDENGTKFLDNLLFYIKQPNNIQLILEANDRLTARLPQEFKSVLNSVKVKPWTKQETEKSFCSFLFLSYIRDNYNFINLTENQLREIVRVSDKVYPKMNYPEKAIKFLDDLNAKAIFKDRKSKLTTAFIRQTAIERADNKDLVLTKWQDKLSDLNSDLNKVIINQKQATREITNSLKLASVGLQEKNKPIGSFLFVGPTSVGKTETARALAKLLFGSEKTLIRFDMSEYAERFNISRLLGAAPGYVGYDEPAQLEKVNQHPFSVVLFDEIEKADPAVLNIFLQILDNGKITLANGKTVDFSHTIIIMTSNAGQNFIRQSVGFTSDLNPDKQYKYKQGLKQYFAPELLNRFNKIVVFNDLNKADLKSVLDLSLKDYMSMIAKNNKLTVDYDLNSLAKVLFNRSNSSVLNARNIKQLAKDQVSLKLADFIISNKKIKKMKVIGKNNKIIVEKE